MNNIPNFEKSLELISKNIREEIKNFYDNPKNIEKFELWKKQKRKRAQQKN